MAHDWRRLADPLSTARWDELAARAVEPNPFFESWFLLPALKAHDTEGNVRILLLESEGQWLGLVPISHDRRYYHWPVPQLCSWLHGNCFLGQPLIARGHEMAFWRGLLAWADRNCRSGLFLHLPHVPLHSRSTVALAEVLAQQRRSAALVHREDRAMLQSQLAPDAYLGASLSGKKRKELRRQNARLSELGAVTVERREGGEGLCEWIDAFLDLEASGWKGQAGSAMAASSATTGLFRDALRGAAQRGKLERLAILLDGRPIAMLANFLAAPGAFSFKTAFDETYSRYSPGVLLQRENLSLLEREGVDWCDSCAAADHPMIDHIWRERRAVGRLSIAIGGKARRALFRLFVAAETRSNPLYSLSIRV